MSKKAVSPTARRKTGAPKIRKLAAKKQARLESEADAAVVFRPLAKPDAGPTAEEIKAQALKSAKALRDCSFNPETSAPMRRSCRRVMRGQALKWREG